MEGVRAVHVYHVLPFPGDYNARPGLWQLLQRFQANQLVHGVRLVAVGLGAAANHYRQSQHCERTRLQDCADPFADPVPTV